MSEAEEETQPEATESADTATAVEAEAAEGGNASDQSDAKAADAAGQSQPEFQPLRPSGRQAEGNFELNRFGGVQVVLTAELGRTQLTLQELMSLSEGAVLELHRAISEPVELMAQGVPLGNAEVVVVDDQFAIRVKQIYAS